MITRPPWTDTCRAMWGLVSPFSSPRGAWYVSNITKYINHPTVNIQNAVKIGLLYKSKLRADLNLFHILLRSFNSVVVGFSNIYICIFGTWLLVAILVTCNRISTSSTSLSDFIGCSNSTQLFDVTLSFLLHILNALNVLLSQDIGNAGWFLGTKS